MPYYAIFIFKDICLKQESPSVRSYSELSVSSSESSLSLMEFVKDYYYYHRYYYYLLLVVVVIVVVMVVLWMRIKYFQVLQFQISHH
jgi:hypothetical protein